MSHRPPRRDPEETVPHIRAFRALRYDASKVGDLGLVVAPPYDIIDPDERSRLIGRHPANVVRLDLPAEESGDEPDDRYRRAARTLAGWRSDGTLRKDPHPSIYVYEQTYRVPGTDVERTQRGFFARLRLEPFGPGSGVLPHERTLVGPREDRYKLLRATGVNTSPVIGLFDDVSGGTGTRLAAVAADPPDMDVTDDDGVRHRLWAVLADGEGASADVASELISAASSGPVSIADGHHRYETALRYRDERRMTRSCEEDPAFDYILMLFLEASGEPLTVLPTHRLVRDLGEGGAGNLRDGASELFDVEPVADADALVRHFDAAGLTQGGDGRFGLWTRAGGAWLTARRAAFGPWLPPGGAAVQSLDVTLLGVALDRLAGIDAAAVASGRVAYTKSATEAIAAVERGDGIDAAFLLEPTPVSSIEAVARDGDVMPQKSTYFYPKALTGLLINPHEW
ncbi:MAG: DUF1015 domain-containing protein [Chloroflexota bacterium]|jgi:uncharacterized protein (DUF1015 family)|nr:DUF1015 domain-containing protein [Chloroflexota bacterium]MDH5243029.1 DUF1015 domain-containing protein [Chloroflexota bacterium]